MVSLGRFSYLKHNRAQIEQAVEKKLEDRTQPNPPNASRLPEIGHFFQKMFCARSALARSAVGAAAQRRETPLGAAQRREAPPQAAEQRAPHKVHFCVRNFRRITECEQNHYEKCV